MPFLRLTASTNTLAAPFFTAWHLHPNPLTAPLHTHRQQPRPLTLPFLTARTPIHSPGPAPRRFPSSDDLEALPSLEPRTAVFTIYVYCKTWGFPSQFN